jgi:methylated-DNA-[protein]-cysteine S-methyltransferase
MNLPPLALHLYPSAVGGLLLTATPDALTGLYFDNERSRVTGDAVPVDPRPHPILSATVAQLDDYFAGRRRAFETCAYRDIATRIGQPSAVRAVGLANGRNPISIIVPCHRVIGADGTLTGYGGGLPIKRALLTLEGALPDTERVRGAMPDLFATASPAAAA